MDKFDKVTESEESDSDSSSSSTKSDEMSDSTTILLERHGNNNEHRQDLHSSNTISRNGSSLLLACGVSKKHPPIYTYLVQICILQNHAVGKDTHVRGIKIFGPPTVQSREKAKRDAKQSRESRRITGSRAIRLRQEKEAKRKRKAKEGLMQWVNDDTTETNNSGDDEAARRQNEDDTNDHDHEQTRLRHTTSRTLELLSTLR